MLRTTRAVLGHSTGHLRPTAPSPHGRSPLNGIVPAWGAELHGSTRGAIWTIPEPEELWLRVLGASLPFRGLVGVVTLDDGPVAAAIVRRAELHFRAAVHIPLVAVSGHHQRRTTAAGSIAPALSQLVTNNPYKAVPRGELDVICFTGHTFATLLNWHAHHVTEATALLKPHGVMAIFCQRKARLVGPRPLEEDWTTMVDYLMECSGDASSIAEHVAYEFTSFPHMSMTRKWFVSEYQLTMPMLQGYVRSWKEYRHHAAARASIDKLLATTDDSDDGLALGRMSLPAAGDPLDAFTFAVEAYLRAHHPGGDIGDVCRMEVDHGVILCDNRPSNRPPTVDVDLGRTLRQSLAS